MRKDLISVDLTSGLECTRVIVVITTGKGIKFSLGNNTSPYDIYTQKYVHSTYGTFPLRNVTTTNIFRLQNAGNSDLSDLCFL